jgi:hypothetical protein
MELIEAEELTVIVPAPLPPIMTSSPVAGIFAEVQFAGVSQEPPAELLQVTVCAYAVELMNSMTTSIIN